MSRSVYIEDIFIEFYTRILSINLNLDYIDIAPCDNFYNICSQNKSLTEKQANYIMRLLTKYKSQICDENFDYSKQLKEKKFKNPFRVIDNIKRLYAEKNDIGQLFIYMQFPFAFKEKFMEEFSKRDGFANFEWDEIKYARKIDFFDADLLHIHSFALDNNFIIDESFEQIVSDLEQAIENQDLIEPHSVVENFSVKLVTEKNNVLDFFQNNKTDDVSQSMFLAKTMGYPVKLEKIPQTSVEKISSSSSNIFWLKEISELFEIYKKLKLKTAIIIDRAQDHMHWLESFLEKSEISGIPKSKIKVCFREDKIKDTGLNQWIKNNDLGGRIEDGDILIFQHSPPKWLFKETNYVKILVTTIITPSTSYLTSQWLKTHPCVIYLSEIRPTLIGINKIVQL